MITIQQVATKLGVENQTDLRQALLEKTGTDPVAIAQLDLTPEERGVLTAFLGKGDATFSGKSLSRKPDTLLVDTDKPLPASWVSFTQTRKPLPARELLFHGAPDGYFVTNPAKPFPLPDGRILLPAREQRDPQLRPQGAPLPGPSRVGLYISDPTNADDLSFTRVGTLLENNNDWHEDPAIAHIGDDIIVAAVEVNFERKGSSSIMTGFRTNFYKLDPDTLTLGDAIAHGPENMKDVRVFELPDGSVGVLTRPKGGEFGKGYVGFTRVSSVEEITPEKLLAAQPILRPADMIASLPALEGFGGDVWVGGNDAVVNDDGTATVFGHFGTPGPYCAIRFDFDPKHPEAGATNIELLAVAEDFAGVPDGPIRPNTVFAGGVAQLGDKLMLTTGLNDYRSGLVEVG